SLVLSVDDTRSYGKVGLFRTVSSIFTHCRSLRFVFIKFQHGFPFDEVEPFSREVVTICPTLDQFYICAPVNESLCSNSYFTYINDPWLFDGYSNIYLQEGNHRTSELAVIQVDVQKAKAAGYGSSNPLLAPNLFKDRHY